MYSIFCNYSTLSYMSFHHKVCHYTKSAARWISFLLGFSPTDRVITSSLSSMFFDLGEWQFQSIPNRLHFCIEVFTYYKRTVNYLKQKGDSQTNHLHFYADVRISKIVISAGCTDTLSLVSHRKANLLQLTQQPL